MIQKIAPKSSAITRYNAENSSAPLVETDIIVSVNGSDKVDDMMNHLKNSTIFTLSIMRGS